MPALLGEDLQACSDVAPLVVELMRVEAPVAPENPDAQPIVPRAQQIRVNECGRVRQSLARFEDTRSRPFVRAIDCSITVRVASAELLSTTITSYAALVRCESSA
jgi:hypothetical protein